MLRDKAVLAVQKSSSSHPGFLYATVPALEAAQSKEFEPGLMRQTEIGGYAVIEMDEAAHPLCGTFKLKAIPTMDGIHQSADGTCESGSSDELCGIGVIQGIYPNQSAIGFAQWKRLPASAMPSGGSIVADLLSEYPNLVRDSSLAFGELRFTPPVGSNVRFGYAFLNPNEPAKVERPQEAGSRKSPDGLNYDEFQSRLDEVVRRSQVKRKPPSLNDLFRGILNIVDRETNDRNQAK